MKFFELLRQVNWLSVELTLLKLYPDVASTLEEHMEVYHELLEMQPEEFEMEIVLEEHTEIFDGQTESYVSVSGREPNNSESESYAIEYVEWKHWLAMDIAEESLANYPELEIVAHCLYEMTFAGFNEEEIQDEMEYLRTIKEDYDNATQEEKDQNTFTLEDLKNIINKDDLDPLNPN